MIKMDKKNTKMQRAGVIGLVGMSDFALYSLVKKSKLKEIEKKYNVKIWRKYFFNKEISTECRKHFKLLYDKFNRLFRELMYCIKLIECNRLKGKILSEKIMNYRESLLRNFSLIQSKFSLLPNIKEFIKQKLEMSINLIKDCNIYCIKRYLELILAKEGI